MEDSYQNRLFEDCATHCDAYEACGGYRPTAPCGCIYPLYHEKRHKCDECPYNCRERGMYCTSGKLRAKSFAKEVSDGLALEQVAFRQTAHQLPILAPSYTHKYKGSEKFSSWVAIDVRVLFSCRRRQGAIIRPCFSDADKVRNFFQVSSECKLIAVLNGEDKFLESLWASQRQILLGQLRTLGFSLCTAPTFSLNALTVIGTPTPFSHHTTMLMRHHRFLAEIDIAGLCAIPNLYTLDGNVRQINQWANWLRNNIDINIVSRDFTMTRNWSAIKIKVADLITILTKAGRSFQVLIIGTGQANAGKIAFELSSAGHKATVATSAPILKAVRGGAKYMLDAEGKLSDIACSKMEMSRDELIQNNLDLFETALMKSIEKGKLATNSIRGQVRAA